MSRFFSVGPFPFGVAARFGGAFLGAIFAGVAFFAVVVLEVAFLLISAPELALDRSTRFRVWRKRCARLPARRRFSRKRGLAFTEADLSANRRRTANSQAAGVAAIQRRAVHQLEPAAVIART